MARITVERCPVCGNEDLNLFMEVKDHSISEEVFDLVKCPDCGLTITQDHPDQRSIGPYYASDDYISHSNTSRGLVNRLYHTVRDYMLGRKQALVQKHVRPGKLLDIGAGTGYFAAHMKRSGWDVTGLEPDAGARKVALETLQLELKDVSALYDLPGETFDVVTMWHVLEHVHDLNKDLDEIHRIMKPGGLFVVAVPNPTSRDARKYGEYWAAYDVPRHLWHFSPESMRRLLVKHSFTPFDTRSMPFDAFYVAMLSEKYKGNSLTPIRGGLAGFATYLASGGNVENASSVIYLSRKNTVS